jgi:hypothetical protein
MKKNQCNHVGIVVHAQAVAAQANQAAWAVEQGDPGLWARTSLSCCLAVLVPASAFSIRMPAMRR